MQAERPKDWLLNPSVHTPSIIERLKIGAQGVLHVWPVLRSLFSNMLTNFADTYLQIIVSPHSIIFVAIQRGHASERFVYNVDESPIKKLQHFLSDKQDWPMHVLFDIAEIEFKTFTFPHVNCIKRAWLMQQYLKLECTKESWNSILYLATNSHHGHELQTALITSVIPSAKLMQSLLVIKQLNNSLIRFESLAVLMALKCADKAKKTLVKDKVEWLLVMNKMHEKYYHMVLMHKNVPVTVKNCEFPSTSDSESQTTKIINEIQNLTRYASRLGFKNQDTLMLMMSGFPEDMVSKEDLKESHYHVNKIIQLSQREVAQFLLRTPFDLWSKIKHEIQCVWHACLPWGKRLEAKSVADTISHMHTRFFARQFYAFHAPLNTLRAATFICMFTLGITAGSILQSAIIHYESERLQREKVGIMQQLGDQNRKETVQLFDTFIDFYQPYEWLSKKDSSLNLIRGSFILFDYEVKFGGFPQAMTLSVPKKRQPLLQEGLQVVEEPKEQAIPDEMFDKVTTPTIQLKAHFVLPKRTFITHSKLAKKKKAPTEQQSYLKRAEQLFLRLDASYLKIDEVSPEQQSPLLRKMLKNYAAQLQKEKRDTSTLRLYKVTIQFALDKKDKEASQ